MGVACDASVGFGAIRLTFMLDTASAGYVRLDMGYFV